MTYDVRNNRLLRARMKFGCDGRVKAYREKAWKIALEEARKRSLFEQLLFAASQSMALLKGGG